MSATPTHSVTDRARLRAAFESFAGLLPDAEWTHFEGHVGAPAFAPGQRLVREGQHPATRIYFILAGAVRVGPDAVVRVTLWEGRPFIFVPGEGEAELLPIGPDLFTIHVVAGVSVRFERGDDGRIEGVVLTLGDRIMRARRLP